MFLDGDCILTRDHVRIHLERRRPGVVMAGDCCRLDQPTSERVTSEAIRSGAYAEWGPESERRRLSKLDRSSRFYCWIRHPTKPKLIGNNVGIWRSDFERVNGYDENFEGWGCEDDDLRWRLRKSGVRIESILRWTRTYHLWHPTDVTAPTTWRQGANVDYLLRKGRLTRCRNGLTARRVEDLSIRVVGHPAEPHTVERLLGRRFADRAAARPEVEILFLPGKGGFSGRADYNVLVALDAQAARSRHARRAHLTIVSQPAEASHSCLPLDPQLFERALAAVA